MMQKIGVIVTLFYVATFSTVFTCVLFLIKYSIKSQVDESFTIISLSKEQVLFSVLAGAANLLALASKTIAY